jgi:hypothetical protein
MAAMNGKEVTKGLIAEAVYYGVTTAKINLLRSTIH